MISHTIMGGKVYVYKRDNSRFWQCSTHFKNKNYRVSTKEESLAHAQQVAEDWYFELRGKSRAGLLKTEKTFADAARQTGYGEITTNQRAPRHPGRHQSERPADFDRNRWPTSIGLPSRHHRNPHFSGPDNPRLRPGYQAFSSCSRNDRYAAMSPSRSPIRGCHPSAASRAVSSSFWGVPSGLSVA
jgi:hypothetical protein